MQEGRGIPHIGTYQLPQLHQLIEDGLGVHRGLVVQMLEEHVLHFARGSQPFHQPFLIEQVAQLDADLGVFVRVEGGDAALGGAEGLAAQSLLLIGVLQHMIGHQQLHPLGDHQIGGGSVLRLNVLQLGHQLLHVQCHAVADDIGHMGVERAGGQDVQGEAAIIVDDGVAGIGAALEADHDVGMFRQQVCDLTLAFVAPVRAYDCFYHDARLLLSVWKRPFQRFSQRTT